MVTALLLMVFTLLASGISPAHSYDKATHYLTVALIHHQKK